MYDSSQETYRFGRFSLSPARHALYLDDAEVTLTPKSFDVLLYLTRNSGRVVSREELLKAVWNDAHIEESNLAQQVFRLRKAFEVEPTAANLIRTVSGRGYQFTAEVIRDTPAAYAFEHFRERTQVVVEEFSPVAVALPAPAPSRITAQGLLIGAAAATLVAVAVAGGLSWRKRLAVPATHHEIVLADFENRTGDSVFDYVLKNALTIDLQQSPELTVLPSAQVKTILKQMERSPTEALTRSLALEVCARSSDKAVLTGSITRLDRHYVVALDATDCRSGTVFAALQSQAPEKDAVIQSLDEIDARMRNKLGESLESINGFDVPIQQATTASLDALVAYSRGATLSDSEAIPYYQQALQLDPNFALAWRKLGVSYENLGDVPAAKQAYTRAYQLRGPASAFEQYLISTQYTTYVLEDMDEGIRSIHTWLASYPDAILAWGALANDQNLLGLYDQAIESAKRGRGAHPTWYYYFVLSSAYLRASQFAPAEALCREGLAAFPDNDILHRIMEEIVFDTHDGTEYNRQTAWSHGTGTGYQTLEQQAREAAASGQLKRAQSLYEAARNATRQQNFPAFLDTVNSDEANDEAVLGRAAAAAEHATRVPPVPGESAFVAALGAALAGDLAYTEKVVQQFARSAPPSSTLAQKVELPILRAAIELGKGHPDRAIELIEPAKPYQLRDLNLPYLLGAAYLANHQPDEAAAEYRLILANPGVDGKSPMFSLAHLGLARADVLQAKITESRAQYEEFFTLWRGADQDLPILRQAHLEFSRLK